MSRITHVLDTSALLAHYFNEAGAGIVEGLWSDETFRVAISAVTVAELKGRLHQGGSLRPLAAQVVSAPLAVISRPAAARGVGE